MQVQNALSYIRRCVQDYEMIAPGDHICVGVSGGKDSVLLLYLLASLRRFYPKPFSLTAVTLDMRFEGKEGDFSEIRALCEQLEVPFILQPTDIGEVVFTYRQEKHPCSLCANLRRGHLYSAAKAAGCNKVALGHHLDDAVETAMLSLLYEGRMSCFSPVSYLSRMELTLIRPMLYVYEKDVMNLVRRLSLPLYHNPCPANGYTKRQEVKELLLRMSGEMGLYDVKQKIFGAMQRFPFPGWAPAPSARQSSRKSRIQPESLE